MQWNVRGNCIYADTDRVCVTDITRWYMAYIYFTAIGQHTKPVALPDVFHTNRNGPAITATKLISCDNGECITAARCWCEYRIADTAVAKHTGSTTTPVISVWGAC
jgi:hypothetical protein